MIDLEKVINGLELLHDRLLDAAKRDAIAMLDASMVADAIALLKEQEPAKPREERHEVKVSHDCGDEVEVWSKFYCPHCGAMIANSNSKHFPRCMWCGRKVKWK